MEAPRTRKATEASQQSSEAVTEAPSDVHQEKQNYAPYTKYMNMPPYTMEDEQGRFAFQQKCTSWMSIQGNNDDSSSYFGNPE